MRRLAPHQQPKQLELASQLTHGRVARFVHRLPCTSAIHPLSEVDMETDAKLRMSSRVVGGIDCGSSPNHQARARDNTVLMGGGHAAIDPRAAPEVVRIDNENPLFHLEA